MCCGVREHATIGGSGEIATMTTRARKQQEDQMAVFLTLLEEQKQLNLEQREQQEALAA